MYIVLYTVMYDMHTYIERRCTTFKIVYVLFTQIRLASFLWDMGKQCRLRSDAVERSF